MNLLALVPVESVKSEKMPDQLPGKIYRVLKERPLFFLQYVRTYWLFQRTRAVIAVARILGIYPKSIGIGRGTRVQRVRCLRAEQPRARISVGEYGIVYEHAKIEAYGEGRIHIGPCAVIGDARIYCRSSIRIGARFLSSWNVMIQDYDPHPIDPALRARQVEGICGRGPALTGWEFPSKSIEIGDDVWLGAGVTILKGVRIGNGCLVAAGSVVLEGDFPANSIIAGNPAKVVKSL